MICSPSITLDALRRYAVQGIVDPATASESFAKAATAFEQDTLERSQIEGQKSWSCINCKLWAPYFRSRSYIAKCAEPQADISECIKQASRSLEKELHFAHPGVHNYQLFIWNLAEILGIADNPFNSLSEVDRKMITRWASADDPSLLQFVDEARTGIRQLQQDRTKGLTLVGRAMATLDRLPLVGQTEAEGIQAALDRHMLVVVEGPNRTWIHRSLEEITDEAQLRKLLLRLFQNQIPRYAQIRHGPIEYGKDISVVVERDNQLELRSYQVKCGDISKAAWNTEIRPQMEEIFQVPLESFQVPCSIQRRVGVLIWNGHANPHVEPVMDGWSRDQRAHDRRYEFMHLDDIVNYIFDSRLVSVFRAALEELT